MDVNQMRRFPRAVRRFNNLEQSVFLRVAGLKVAGQTSGGDEFNFWLSGYPVAPGLGHSARFGARCSDQRWGDTGKIVCFQRASSRGGYKHVAYVHVEVLSG